MCVCVIQFPTVIISLPVSILYVRTYVCAFRRDGYKIDENTVKNTTYSDWDTISGTVPHRVTLLGTEAVLVILLTLCMYHVCLCISVRIVRSHLLVWLSKHLIPPASLHHMVMYVLT